MWRCCYKIYIGKVFLVHAMKVCRGSRGTAPFITNLGTWRWVVNFMFQPHYLLERTPVAIEYEAAWAAAEQVWTFRKRETPACAHTLVSILSTLWFREGVWGTGGKSLRSRWMWSPPRFGFFTLWGKSCGTHRTIGWVASEPVLDAGASIKVSDSAGTRTFS